MNNILRLENFELLMCHRYYISDLCQMIERSYAQNKFSQKQLVYRADKLSKGDLDIIKKSIDDKNARISINGFISTSKNEKISLEYAEAKLKKRGNDIVIMYEITIDPAIPCSSYADIQSISFHPREEEVLFNMGSSFQIDSIDPDPSNSDIQRIKLTAQDFNINLLDEMKGKVKQSSQATLSILLVRYLIELGEDRVSKRYLNQLIKSKQLENDPNLVAVCNCLGAIHFRQNLYGEALKYYRMALNIQARLQFSNNNALAEIFNNIGQTHWGLNQLDEAEQNLEEGIRIQKREPKHAQQHLVSLYCNLGQVAYAQHDFDKAGEHFELAYDLCNRNTKISHDALEKRLLKAELCIAFGHLKSAQNRKDPTEANKKFQEALNIYQCILPASHPKVAEVHIDIVCEYANNGHFQAVIDYYKEHLQPLLKDYENRYSTSQLDLSNLYASVGACFVHQKEFDQAMDIWKKGMEHEQKMFLDELLLSMGQSKIESPTRLIENAYRIALEYYAKKTDAKQEYLAILYSKIYAYDRVIEVLREQASYLLAHTYIILRDLKASMKVYQSIIKSQENLDMTLVIGLLISMLTLKMKTTNEEPIQELERIERLLTKRLGDNEAIRLRMIINDHLAETYLKKGRYNEARQYSQISFELKQHFYSSYHPSLIRNYQLIAACHFQQGDYKNAVPYYEKAIDIQLEHMPSGHADIRSNYFFLGDCYCQMDKIELATEYFTHAQESDDVEGDGEKTIEHDVKSLLRMFTNLFAVHVKQKDFHTASEQQEMKIGTLKIILPKFIVENLEDEDAVSITFDQLKKVLKSRLGFNGTSQLPQILRNFVFIRLSLARVLLQNGEHTEEDEDSTDVYEKAIALQLKLTLCETSNNRDLADRYEELANAYGRLYSSMKESIRDNLLKAVEESTDTNRQRSMEYRLGNLYLDEENYSEADRYWKSALQKVKSDESLSKTIIEKLIEKNQANLSDTDDDDSDDQENDETEETQVEQTDETKSRVQSASSQRRFSIKSLDGKEKPEEIAQVYSDLGDDENAMKYLKRYISLLEETVKPDWSNFEFQNEQLPLMKIFHSLLTQRIHSIMSVSTNAKEISQQAVWMNLLQAHIKLFIIALRMGDEFDQVAKVVSATFHIAEKLYDLPEYFSTLFDRLFKESLDDIQWSQFSDLVSPMETTNILIALAEYHLSKTDSLQALQVYCVLQKNIADGEMLRNAINYGILKLLELYVSADEDYCENIIAIDIRSSNIPIFDRIILCRLIIAFMEELEDETSANLFEKELVELQKEEWSTFNLEVVDGIGQILTKFDHTALAYRYWLDLENLYNESLPKLIVSRLHSTDSTFKQIYRAIQDMFDDLSDNIFSLAQSYTMMLDCEENDNLKGDICQSLETAITIGKKMPSFQDTVEKWQKKLNDLTDT